MASGTRTKANALQQISMADTVKNDQHISSSVLAAALHWSHFQDLVEYYGPGRLFSLIGNKLLQQPASNLLVIYPKPLIVFQNIYKE